MTEPNPDRPNKEDERVRAILVALGVTEEYGLRLVSTLQDKGFTEAGAVERLLYLAFSLWPPEGPPN